MKVLAAHDGMGCGYYRMLLPLKAMAELGGHEVTFAKQGEDLIQESLGRAGEYDVVVGQRFLSYDGLSPWRRARRPGNRLVYENDDDLFSVTTENWAAFQTFRRHDVREAIRAYCESADLVTVTTPELAEVMAEEIPGARFSVLPNFIPGWVLGTERERTERPRIGWAGAASHALDVHEATKPVRRFLKRMPGWDLYLGGTDYRPSFNVRNWDQMIHGGWTQVNEDPAGFYGSLNFDVGLAPLRDTRFTRSKSALKCLEYNARGIPVIASDVAPYRRYVRDGENGFLVRHEHEWLSRLMELANDEDLRLKMSRRSREIAAEHAVEGNWKLWEAAYQAIR